MNERAFVTLKRNKELVRFIEANAHRHFGRDEDDRKDAIAEAWERIWKQHAGLSLDEYKKHGYRAIAAMYQRMRRKRNLAPEISVDAGDEKTPSAALAALAQKAIDGDW